MNHLIFCAIAIFQTWLPVKPTHEQYSNVQLLLPYHSFDLLILANLESRYRTRAVSSAGAKGVMQLTPIAVKDVYSRECVYLDGEFDYFDPVTNIQVGACYFLYLRDTLFPGDIRKAVAAYNAGPSRAVLPEHRWPRETRRYVAEFVKLRNIKECKR